MNVLTFERLIRASTGPMDGAPLDTAVPVVDGVRLCDLLLGDPYPGVDPCDIAPPSRHRVGEPEGLVDGGVVLLDGSCGIAECCGVVARIAIEPDHVRWHDLKARDDTLIPRETSFTFDRDQYEAALAGVGALEPQPWSLPDDERRQEAN